MPEEVPAPRWGLAEAAVGLIPTVLSAIGFLSTLGDDASEEEAITLGSLVVSSLLLWVFLVGVPLFAAYRKGNGPVRDFGFRFTWRDLAAFPLGVALQAIAVPLLYWPILRLLDRPSSDVENEARQLVETASGPGILVLVLVVGVGAPLAEELFYRGLFLRAVANRWSIAAGVAASTVIFGMGHFQGIQMPALLLFGAVVSYLAARTGRLGPSILCHAGFNGWTLFQLLVLDPS